MKQLRLPLAALLGLSLAACSQYGRYGDPYGYPPQQPESYPGPYPAPYPTPYPGEQPGLQEPYRALGNEPFWSLTVDGREMRYEEMNGLVIVEPTPPVEPAYRGDLFRGRRLELYIERQPCGDGMSDRTYPDRVVLHVDGRRYDGCGGPASMYRPGWEQGTSPDYQQGGGYDMLARTNWQVVALNGRQVPTRDFYLNFFPDNRMQAKFGCNTINAPYQQTNGRLTVGAQSLTRMSCPDMGPETTGANILSSPMTLSRSGDRLTLRNARGTIEARRAQ